MTVKTHDIGKIFAPSGGPEDVQKILDKMYEHYGITLHSEYSLLNDGRASNFHLFHYALEQITNPKATSENVILFFSSLADIPMPREFPKGKTIAPHSSALAGYIVFQLAEYVEGFYCGCLNKSGEVTPLIVGKEGENLALRTPGGKNIILSFIPFED